MPTCALTKVFSYSAQARSGAISLKSKLKNLGRREFQNFVIFASVRVDKSEIWWLRVFARKLNLRSENGQAFFLLAKTSLKQFSLGR
jgi:hypothetical protein